jgi:aminoglycoside phosphotransferase (APT) family kinase protein
VHAVTIRHHDGRREKFTVRRLRPHDAAAEPGGLEREARLLRLLEHEGIAAPRPVYFDAVGKHFGEAASVLTFIPGKLNVAETNTGPWTDALAATLLSIHAITPQNTDLSFLPLSDPHDRMEDLARDHADDPLARRAVEVLRTHVDLIEPLPPVLVHNDYWSGNTVWYRGRIAGVIDWLHARVGDPRNDVSECRGALVFDHDESVADQFLAAYERRLGHSLADTWFFDLIRAMAAYLYCEYWIEGLHDLGIQQDLGPTRQRIAHFLRGAMAKAK